MKASVVRTSKARARTSEARASEERLRGGGEQVKSQAQVRGGGGGEEGRGERVVVRPELVKVVTGKVFRNTEELFWLPFRNSTCFSYKNYVYKNF